MFTMDQRIAKEDIRRYCEGELAEYEALKKIIIQGRDSTNTT